MMLTFITGNKNKFAEAQAILGNLQQAELDLDEIQELDPTKIIKHKLAQARQKIKGPIMVEDTSFYFEGMQGLPGPLIKWFLQTLGLDGLFQLANKMGYKEARAYTIVGYFDGKQDEQLFLDTCHGFIVAPRGPRTFGWDPIFLPRGFEQTFAEMPKSEKNKISMRKSALEQLKKYLADK